MINDYIQKEDQSLAFDSYLTSITREVENIKERTQQRKKIYQKCMMGFKAHLETEAQQLESTNLKTQQKNNLIRESFEHIYDTINQGSDTMLRQIRKTFESKTHFWKQIIKDFADETDLELKRELYQAKKETEQNYLEAIEQRKVKNIPFNKLVIISERDKALSNFQQSNRKLQTNVFAGTMLRMTQPERNRFNDDKENTMLENWGVKEEIGDSKKKEESADGILGRFMKNR